VPLKGVKFKGCRDLKNEQVARSFATDRNDEPSSSPPIQNATQTGLSNFVAVVAQNARCAISFHGRADVVFFFGDVLWTSKESHPAAGRDRRS